MTPEIFEDLDDFFHKAAEKTAERQRCHIDLVYACMQGLDAIWNTPNHLDRVREVTGHLNKAASHARELYWSLRQLTEAQREDLLTAGCVTIFQVEHLASVLEMDSQSLNDFLKSRGRIGGKNLAAYDVAEMIRRLFRRQRRAITFGKEPNTDFPSTDFCRAVNDALGDFGIRVGWRGPATEARNYQLRIDARYRRICEGRRLRRKAERS